MRRLENFGEGHARELGPSGNAYEDLLPLTARHRIDDVEIVFLNAEGLIMLKADSLRPQDQIDVQALRKIFQDRDGSAL